MFFNKRKEQKKEQKIPEPGEYWGLYDNSPWPRETNKVLIKDVKDGWVRYDMNPNTCVRVFRDERIELETFLIIYAPVV